MVWYSHLLKNFPQFIEIHTVKGFGIVNEAEIHIFLELSCFFDDPADFGNLISGFVLLLSSVQLFVASWTPADQSSLSFTISQSWLKVMSTELVMLSNTISSSATLFSCPHSFPTSGSFPVSQLFPSGGQSFSISPSNEYE